MESMEAWMGSLFISFITIGLSLSTPWFHINSTCFQSSQHQVDQQEARSKCRAIGAVLHSVQSYEEMQKLKDFLKPNADYWVALKQYQKDFKWDDGRDCCPRNWWSSKEPNVGDNCARIQTLTPIKLFGHSCTTLFGYICSKDIVSRWSLMNNKTYNLDNLCGVEIMSDCKRQRSCEDLCESRPDCDKFATFANLCINIKDKLSSAGKEHCAIRLRSNAQLFKKKGIC